MGDHQHVGGKDQNRDVAAHFSAVEVRFQVDQVRDAVAAVQRIVNDIGHKPGVEACLLQRALKALALRAVAV
jgi:hypothetical protein